MRLILLFGDNKITKGDNGEIKKTSRNGNLYLCPRDKLVSRAKIDLFFYMCKYFLSFFIGSLHVLNC